MAMDGSLPAASSLFCHQKPNFTLGLLFAEAGKGIEKAVQCPVESPGINVLVGQGELLVNDKFPKLTHVPPALAVYINLVKSIPA